MFIPSLKNNTSHNPLPVVFPKRQEAVSPLGTTQQPIRSCQTSPTSTFNSLLTRFWGLFLAVGEAAHPIVLPQLSSPVAVTLHQVPISILTSAAQHYRTIGWASSENRLGVSLLGGDDPTKCTSVTLIFRFNFVSGLCLIRSRYGFIWHEGILWTMFSKLDFHPYPFL